MRKFYYELEDDGSYTILEEGGGCEHGQYYDTALCWVTDEKCAGDLIVLLHKLQETKKYD